MFQPQIIEIIGYLDFQKQMNPFLSLIWKHLQVKDLMPEFSSMLLAVLIGGFTIIGGLGGTFYVSYINGIFIFSVILILQVSNF